MGTTSKKAKKDDDQPLPFEEAMEELENLVEEMESDRMPLNDLVDHYERGSKLLKVCQKRLAEAEQRIQMIVARDSGVELKEFDEEESNSSPDEAEPEHTGQEEGDDDGEIRLF